VSVPGGELVFPFDRDTVAAAKIRLARVAFEGQVATALCQVSAMLGIASLRAPVLALRVARAHAALCDRVTLNDDDVAVAGRLVLAPRAVVLPRPADDDPPAEQPEREHSDDQASAENGELEDVVLDAVRAAVPQGLLELMKATPTNVRRASLAGRTGAQKAALRGRPAGVRRGDPRMGARLNVVETLRAAAPWQKLRRRNSGASGTRVVVRRDDFRVGRFVQRTESATVFVVDASGSSALHRLAEAKGAVEILLADCYVRRDQVALIAFRGKAAELLLPPTRSLARAKRSLSSLPGGGGTPVASALDCAGALAHSLRRKGLTPAVVLLTDGRANVARNGAVGREPAEVDALASARGFRTLGFSSLLVDTSPAPGPLAGRLAAEMGARYLALPRADALAISRAVTDAAHSP
jgi:magnesium chelatase subunit D